MILFCDIIHFLLSLRADHRLTESHCAEADGVYKEMTGWCPDVLQSQRKC